MRGPKRRDIGHGALAERALLPMIPPVEEFPYTIRVVSDILESNGSSSMASVCGSTLSLMDAGVKIKKPVAGIAMGLIKEGDDYVVLSDIAGVEDHLGDMDFKIAGTPDGITALQMDIKISGVTFEILKKALEQAREGRLFILGKMKDAISETRAELSPHAPRITSIQIDPEKIGTVIGKGGETIRALSEEYEAQIDVDDEGMVLVYAVNGEKGDACVEAIRQMTKDVELGETFTGKVVKTTTFGAFVELTKGTDGLLHISNLVPGGRAESVEDVVNRGDEVKVRVVELNKERGPHRAAARRRSRDRRQDGRGAVADRHRQRRTPPGGAAVTAAAAVVGATGSGGGRDRGRSRRPGLAVPGTTRLTELDSGIRVVTERVPSVRSIALGLWVRVGSRDESDSRGGHLALPRAHAVQGHAEADRRADRAGVRRPRRGGERGHQQGGDGAARPLPRRAPRPRFRGAGRHAAALHLRGPRVRARGGARGDRDVRGRASGQGARRPLRGDLRRPSAGPAGDRPRRGDRRPDRGQGVRLSRRPLCARHDRGRGGRQPRARPDRGPGAASGSPTASGTDPRDLRRLLRAAAASASPFTARRPSSTTSASAERASPATTSAASPCRSWTRSWAAPPPRACSRRCARSAAWPTAVYSWASQYQDTGQVGIYVGTREDNVVQALDVIGAELERLRQEPVAEEELRRAREHVKGRLALSMESTASRMTPARAFGADGHAAADPRRDDRAARGGDARGPRGADASSCTRPPACRWPRSGVTRACFRGALGPVGAELSDAA